MRVEEREREGEKGNSCRCTVEVSAITVEYGERFNGSNGRNEFSKLCGQFSYILIYIRKKLLYNHDLLCIFRHNTNLYFFDSKMNFGNFVNNQDIKNV